MLQFEIIRLCNYTVVRDNVAFRGIMTQSKLRRMPLLFDNWLYVSLLATAYSAAWRCVMCHDVHFWLPQQLPNCSYFPSASAGAGEVWEKPRVGTGGHGRVRHKATPAPSPQPQPPTSNQFIHQRDYTHSLFSHTSTHTYARLGNTWVSFGEWVMLEIRTELWMDQD